jgi:hypothetical protein
MLLHMKNKYDDMQVFNHPHNLGFDSIPEEELEIAA